MYAGAYLNKPEKQISSSAGENDRLVYGVAQMQGWRTGQEDAHSCILDFDDSFSMFAVYDGHGGPEVSTLARRHLPSFILASQYWSPKSSSASSVKSSLVDAFMSFDESLLSDSMLREMMSIRSKSPFTTCVGSSSSSCVTSKRHEITNHNTVTIGTGKIKNDHYSNKKTTKSSQTHLSSSTSSRTSAVTTVSPAKKRSMIFETGSDSPSRTPIPLANIKLNSPTTTGDLKIIEQNKVTDFTIGYSNGINHGYIPAVHSGSTACILLINKHSPEVFVANIGDSRCVLARASGSLAELSVDHKPDEVRERQRIERAGGWLGVDQRVNDVLNLSRSFGDHAAKCNTKLPKDQQIVVAYPDVRLETLLPTDKFLVVACDGIWNSLTSQELVDLISQRLSKGKTPVQVCEEVCEMCLSATSNGLDDTGCDNMTIIIVKLKH